MRGVFTLLLTAMLLGGCSGWSAGDALNAGGKLLYDSLKAKHDADERGL